MPYSGPSDESLPSDIAERPQHEREVFVATFNEVWDDCISSERASRNTCEERANRIARAAANRAGKDVKLAIDEITTAALREEDNQEILSLHHRLHQLWGANFAGNTRETTDGMTRELLVNKHDLVRREMERRDMEHNIHDELDRGIKAGKAKQLRLTTLGVGAMESPKYAPAGLLVEAEKARVMIDGGRGAEPKGELDAWLVSDEEGELISEIRKLARKHNVKPAVRTFESNGLKIQPQKVVHTSHDTYGYLITFGSKKIVWAPEFWEFPSWAENADLAFLEAAAWQRPIAFTSGVGGHAPVVRTQKEAEKAGVERVIFVHIGRPVIDAIEKNQTGELNFAEDGQEFRITKSAPPLNRLPNDIMVTPNFVSIVGSAITESRPADLDIVVRADRSDGGLRIQSDNIFLPLRKVLDPNKEGYIHWIPNPAGPHGDYVPLYDLILRRKRDFRRILIRSMKISPRRRYTIQKPRQAHTTDAFSVDELWEEVKDWLDNELDVFASPKIDGFHAIISSDGETSVWFEDSKETKTPVDLPSQLAGSFVIEGEYTAKRGNEWLSRPQLMGAIEDRSSTSVFWIFDLVYYDGQDVSDRPFSERIALARRLDLPNEHFKILPQWKVNNKKDLSKRAKQAQDEILSEGLFVRADVPYKQGATSFAAKLKFVLRVKPIVLDVIKRENGWVFKSGFALGDADVKNVVEFEGKQYADVGNTFVSKKRVASKGDVIEVEVEEIGISVEDEDRELYWGKPTVMGPSDRKTPYVVNQVIGMAKRRGVFKEEVPIKSVSMKQDDEEGGTRSERAKKFWDEHWHENFPKSGEGKFTLQHHWRGLSEEQTSWNEKKLLDTDHSVHGDLRMSFSRNELFGFTVFLGTTDDVKKRNLINLPADDALQGQFKLTQPRQWLTIARRSPFVSEPGGVGSTSQKWSKFFEQDHGNYSIGVWHKHFFELFFKGEKLKGRYLIQYAPVGNRRVWLIKKPKDQTPFAESNEKADVVKEIKSKRGRKWLIWAKPGSRPEKINVNEFKESDDD